MTLEEFTKIKEEIINESPSEKEYVGTYPTYSTTPIQRVGTIGASSFSGGIGGGGLLPFIPIPSQLDNPSQIDEAQQMQEMRNVQQAEQAQFAEQADRIRSEADKAVEYPDSIRAEADKAVEYPDSIRAEADKAVEYPYSIRAEADKAVEYPDSIRAEADKAVEYPDSIRAEADRNVSETLEEGNYQDAKTLEEFYKEQGIFAEDDDKNVTARYFSEAPKATEQAKENLVQRAFREMGNYQRNKMENIGETLAVQLGASTLAAPVIGSIGAASAAAAASTASKAVKSAQDMGKVLDFNAYKRMAQAASAGAGMAAQAVRGAAADTWDAQEQKVIAPLKTSYVTDTNFKTGATATPVNRSAVDVSYKTGGDDKLRVQTDNAVNYGTIKSVDNNDFSSGQTTFYNKTKDRYLNL